MKPSIRAEALPLEKTAALFRALLEQIPAGSIILADRYYCSYFLIALLQQRGVDVVFRIHQCRKYDFARGRRLGEDDHVVTWHKPQRPEWLDAEVYAALPASLTVREMRLQVRRPGYRVQGAAQLRVTRSGA